MLNTTRIVPSSQSGDYVSVEACEAFVKSTVLNTYFAYVIAAACLVFIFYMLYKQGKFKKELDWVNK